MVSMPLTEEAIFKAACKIKSSRGRADYLAEACQGDDLLHHRLISLLRIFDEEKSFLEPIDSTAATFDFPLVEPAGTHIGNYKLLEPIGEGGMGMVYIAEQSEPVQRQVALKLIKPGMDTRQVIARFKTEEQALAVMDHPNIAKVFEAGATESGRPYFVMELVKGIPIHQFCDEHQLDTKQRLELFIQVCHGVQHAHQKGIIHRDLKPSNILVAMYDDQPVPKVIDFGVAKATGEQLTEKSMITRFGQVVGTLEYMSPEQAQFNQLDVDTRSDIYSLGAILYELLTGTPPFEKKRMKDQALDETLRMIREEEPTKPSAKLSSADHMAQIANNRHTQLHKLSALVHGDLDWIVMKALEKKRERRYESANGFALDIERFLKDEPVSAGPPSASYRFRKFARRNKIGLAFTALVAIGLVLAVVGLATSNYLLGEREKETQMALTKADDEAAIANAFYDFVLQDFIYPVDPEFQPDRDLTMIEALNRASARIDNRFHEQPQVRAKIHHMIGHACQSLGKYEKALEHFAASKAAYSAQLPSEDRENIELDLDILEMNAEIEETDTIHEALAEALYIKCKSSFGEADPLTFRAGNLLANIVSLIGVSQSDQDKLKSSEVIARALLKDAKMTYGADEKIVEQLLVTLQQNLRFQGRLKEQQQVLRELLDKEGNDLHPNRIAWQASLARALVDETRYDSAQEIYAELVKRAEQVLGADHRKTNEIRQGSARCLWQLNRFDEAEFVMQEAISSQERSLGAEHRDTLSSMNTLAFINYQAGKYANAEELWKKVAAMEEKVLGPNHDFTLGAKQNLAMINRKLGNYEKAKRIAYEVLETRKQVQGEDHINTLSCMGLVASILDDQGNYAEALKLKEKVLATKRATSRARFGDGPLRIRYIFTPMMNHANSLFLNGEFHSAIPQMQEVLSMAKSEFGNKSRHTLLASLNLAEALAKTGDVEQGQALAEQTLAVCRDELGENHPYTSSAMTTFGEALRWAGLPDQAEEQYREALKLQLTANGEEHPTTLQTKHALAVVINLQKRPSEAEDLLNAVISNRTKLLGPDHPHTLASRHELAVVFANDGRLQEAISVWREILKKRQQMHGAEHPDSIQSELALATGLWKRGWNEEGEDLLNKIIMRSNAIASSGYLENRIGLENLILALQKLGKDDEVAALEAALGGTGK